MQPGAALSGRLEDVHFPDLLLEISQRRGTGILHLNRQAIEKEIYFQDGKIVFAKSNDPDQRLGELLLRRGKVTLKQLLDSASRISPGVRLGTILVQEGHLKAADLYQGVIDQVEEIVYSVFEWSDGSYQFFSSELPGKEVITLSISTPDIINLGIARVWRWSWISKGVGPLDTIYTRRHEWASIAKKMLITPAVQNMIDLLDPPKSLQDILNASRINSYETCKLIWVLLSIGIIEKMPRLDLSVITQPQDKVTDEEIAAATELPATTAEMKPTEIISWQPRRIQPAQPEIIDDDETEEPPKTEPVPAVAELRAPEPSEEVTPAKEDVPPVPPIEEEEPAVPPTVEVSFSDLAELTDQATDATRPRPTEAPEATIAKRITQFNEQHRYVFEMLRMEMGAGVGNFLTKILKRASEHHPLIFEGIRMNEFGELDSEGLRSCILGNLVDDYPEAFQWLIDEERGTASAFLDRKRLEVIDAGLKKIQDRQKDAH